MYNVILIYSYRWLAMFDEETQKYEDEKLLTLLEKSMILFVKEKFSNIPFLKNNKLNLINESYVKGKIHYCIEVKTEDLSDVDIADLIHKHSNKVDFALALIHKFNGHSCSYDEYEHFSGFFHDEINHFFAVHPIAKEFIEYKSLDFYFTNEWGNALNRLF